MSHRLSKPVTFLVIVGIMLFSGMFTSCMHMIHSSQCNSNKMYTGSFLPRDKVAVLILEKPNDVFVSRIDGTETPWRMGQGQMGQGCGLVFEILPGHHTLYVKYYGSKNSVQIEFFAESGHTYELYPVEYTHRSMWYPAVWDITNEIGCPHKKSQAKLIEALLKNSRETDGEKSFSQMYLNQIASTKECTVKDNLPGFGEKKIASIKGLKGEDLQVNYNFDRYKPFIIADGTDGNKYHLKISQVDGRVLDVIGRDVILGSFWWRKHFLIQYYNSDLAYVYRNNRILKIFKELPDGDYQLLDTYSFFEDFETNNKVWYVEKGNPDCDSIITRGKYYIEVKDNNCHWRTIKYPVNIGNNFNIEIESTWQNGVSNHAYGLYLGFNNNNNYRFVVSANGYSCVQLIGDGKYYEPNPIDWKGDTALIGDGNKRNRHKVEVRDTILKYYVNDKYIGSVDNRVNFQKGYIGVVVCDKQTVAFDNLNIVYVGK